MCDDIRIGSLAGTVRVSFHASSIASASHAFTGRTIVADKSNVVAASWQECGSSEEFRTHHAYIRFRAALLALKTVDALLLPCFRGRQFSLHETPTSDQMGPPPPKNAVGGRYNLPGQSVLYLCDSVDGVLREIENDGQATWIQEFAVNQAYLRVVDTRLSADLAFTNQVFWFAESCDSHVANGKPTFSQLIAQLVSELFDGMLVRGVRGTPGAHYSNIVVFRPLDAWRKLLVSGSSPVCHRPNHALQATREDARA